MQEIAWDAMVCGLLPSGTLRSRNPSDPRIIENGSSSSIAFMQHSRKKKARNVLNELSELLHIIALAVILSPLHAYPSMELSPVQSSSSKLTALDGAIAHGISPPFGNNFRPSGPLYLTRAGSLRAVLYFLESCFSSLLSYILCSSRPSCQPVQRSGVILTTRVDRCCPVLRWDLTTAERAIPGPETSVNLSKYLDLGNYPAGISVRLA